MHMYFTNRPDYTCPHVVHHELHDDASTHEYLPASIQIAHCLCHMQQLQNWEMTTKLRNLQVVHTTIAVMTAHCTAPSVS